MYLRKPLAKYLQCKTEPDMIEKFKRILDIPIAVVVLSVLGAVAVFTALYVVGGDEPVATYPTPDKVAPRAAAKARAGDVGSGAYSGTSYRRSATSPVSARAKREVATAAAAGSFAPASAPEAQSTALPVKSSATSAPEPQDFANAPSRAELMEQHRTRLRESGQEELADQLEQAEQLRAERRRLHKEARRELSALKDEENALRRQLRKTEDENEANLFLEEISRLREERKERPRRASRKELKERSDLK
jgi:hypothetical protein